MTSVCVLFSSSNGVEGRSTYKPYFNGHALTIRCTVHEEYELKLFIGCSLRRVSELGSVPGVQLPTAVPFSPLYINMKNDIAAQHLRAVKYYYMDMPIPVLRCTFSGAEE